MGIPGLRRLALYGPYLCQYSFDEAIGFEACGEVLLGVPLPDSHDAGSIFDYGGSQWQLTGVTASVAANATPYDMGWWIRTDTPGVNEDSSAVGSVSFTDTERGFGAYVAIDDHTRIDAEAPPKLVSEKIIPLLQSAFDAVAE